jgi:GntR family transcriptional regulator, arabinose operon transcriptional repressor
MAKKILNPPAIAPAVTNGVKYQHIRSELRTAILAGQYPEGTRIPSEAELGKTFGASRLTVARALKELQLEGLVSRRAGSGTYARRPKVVAGHVFGLLIPDFGHTEIFEPICRGMMHAPHASSHSLLWGHSTTSGQPSEEQSLQLCQQYINQRVSGVFFAPLELVPDMDEVNNRVIDALAQAGIPVVLLDRCFSPYPKRASYDLIGIDNRRAGYMATDHLLKLGCRKISFLARDYSASTVDARIAGYREALLAHSVPCGTGMVHRCDPDDVDFIGKTMGNSSIEAFVCANDLTAAQLMRSLFTLGFRVPEDIRIVGIDDVKYASLLQVPLTTLHQPCEAIGAAALSAMLERVNYPGTPTRDILLPVKLVVRESCGAMLGRAS